MKNLKISPEKIQLAGHGNSTQIGMAVGIAIDRISGNTLTATDDMIKNEIKIELAKPENNIPPYNSYTPEQLNAVDNMLKKVSNSISVTDLERLFDEK
ncbi:hypothetical protein E2X98_18865 [Salmonella enterica]|nr:hypothetical protein [Salmonella enterica]EAO8922159.1 hypothetical protein [Salmonella enterica]EAQ2094723.1 hypothetical protein [Salmonella enterica]EAT6433961.1 hypothetical protein [Salmonella enterica]EAV0548122.1 hypothetical protein [Salmonella enterica]